MAAFTLGTSTLAGGQFVTRAFNLAGSFREIQFRFFQASSGQDMEPHFFEFHYTDGAVSMEAL